MSRIRRSLVYSLIERYGSYVIAFIGTIVLARLLTPTDFGIYSVAASFVMMVEVVRDFSVGNYIVQESELSREVVATVFTISLVLSLFCAALLALLATPVGAFYGDARLSEIMPLLALNFLLVPFGVPSLGCLRREMAFHKLAVISLCYTITNLVVTVALALLGFGYMSLAWATLASGVVRTLVSIALLPIPWAYHLGLVEWRKIAAFGSYSTATAIVNVVHDSLPQLILGRMLGFNAVGLFGRAAGVCQLPDRLFTSALQPVLLPGLADQIRQSRDLKPIYLQSITYVTGLQWPIVLCLALLADPAVHLLLGEQWLAAAPLVRLMTLASLTLFPAFMTYPLLVAVGAIKDTLTMSLISIPPSMVLIFLASFHSLEMVVATQFVTGPLQVYVALWFVRRHVHFTWPEFAGALWRSGAVALLTALPSGLLILLAGFSFHLPISVLLPAGGGAIICWFGALLITRHPLFAEVRRIVAAAWQAVDLTMSGALSRKRL